MAQQIKLGTFDTNTSVVYPKGTWNGWGVATAMTNDPAILRTNQFGLVTSNVYVYTYSVTRSPGETMDYKFYIDTGARYESPAPGTGDPSRPQQPVLQPLRRAAADAPDRLLQRCALCARWPRTT